MTSKDDRAAGDNSDLLKHAETIAGELQLPQRSVLAVLELLDEGNTLPFIARYRKERTGGLQEDALRQIEDGWNRNQALAKRKHSILKAIDEQGMLDPSLREKIESSSSMAELELLYAPYKQKRQTKASRAIERGLQPLADLLLAQKSLQEPKQSILKRFVNAQLGVPSPADALEGALDIVTESWGRDSGIRSWMLRQAKEYGALHSKVKRGQKVEETRFENYADHQERIKRIASHRVLALLRGEREGVLKLKLELHTDLVLRELEGRWITNRRFEFYRELKSAVERCYERILLPATQSSTIQMLKENAEKQAIEVFAVNMRELLLAAPAGSRVTLGIDPGFRTGCKVAVVDETGKYLAHATIFPTPPKSDYESASQRLAQLVKKYDVDLIAIGNGTASRETDQFVDRCLTDHQLDITKVMVSEAGASVYSASELAQEEFPDLDVTIRGAISIARRLQDPLAELVKIDPKAIGVGQYQHDVNQPQLRKTLEQVVESCVNQVGVDLNMASKHLLSRVAGIGPKIAEHIVAYRDEHGSFTSRRQLAKVPKLGKKAFEQAAGFLRIRGGENPLDGSAVHPECYPIVKKMEKRLGTGTKQLIGSEDLVTTLNPEDFVCEQFGLLTVVDIIEELAKPGRDPRQEFQVARFDKRFNSIEDLVEGVVLEGVVTNVTHFGAFVDIGVHQDALIHISQLSSQFVQNPSDVVSVGDLVKVKVLEIEQSRKRISVTRKF